MEHYFWLVLSEDFFHSFAIADVSTDIALQFFPNVGHHEIIAVSSRVEPYAYYFGAKFVKPYREPRALESGVTCYEYALAPIEVVKYINVHSLLVLRHKFLNTFYHVGEHLIGHTWIDSNPQGVVHDKIGSIKIAHDTVASA